MRVFYKAIDGHGTSIADVIEAPTLTDAAESLRRDGLFITDISEAKGNAPRSAVAATPSSSDEGSMKLGELLFFTRQMAMLLRSGSPVVPALHAIGKQMKGAAKTLVEQLADDMEGGCGLAESMRRHKNTFSEVYVAIIGAGESSATLPEMFNRLARLVKYRREIRNRILSAAAYPTLLIFLSIGIITTLITFVIPRFRELFASLGAELPFSTHVMFSLSFFVRDHWVYLVGAMVLLGGLIYWVLHSSSGRQWLINIQTRIPIAKILFIRLIQTQVFRVMGLLLESRVGIVEAIRLTRSASSNRDFEALCDQMYEQLQQGGRLSDALRACPLVAASVTQAIATGEESGNIDQSMLFVADVMDDENAQLIGTLTKLMEPMILIVMGLMVGGIAMSLFLPLFDLAATAR